MNFEQVKELIQLVNESDLSYLEVKSDNNYVKMDKSLYRNTENTSAAVENKSSLLSAIENVAKTEIVEKNETSNNVSAQVEVASAKEDDCEYINAPMVGTFYQSVSPEADPFVTPGEKVSKGQVLCIVEAMKLMNEIVAEFDCEIVSVEAQNGNMVEYGQPMFRIRR